MQTLYEDLALRPMNDLDLLVRQEKLDKTIEMIIALGYQRVPAINDAFENQVNHAALFSHIRKRRMFL